MQAIIILTEGILFRVFIECYFILIVYLGYLLNVILY